MFRQQLQINCNCSLFPQPIFLKTNTFRSPQRRNPHKDNKSKKSLKYHSTSRYKNIEKLSFQTEQVKKMILNKQSSNAQAQTLSSTRQISKLGIETLKSSSQNVTESYYSSNDHLKQRHRNVFQFQKENNENITHHYVSTRASSPLNPYDINSQRKVTFNYKNQHNPITRVNAVSPPPPQKVYHRLTDNTPSTMLANSSSFIPNNSELRKKYLDQKSAISKQSFNQLTFPDHPRNHPVPLYQASNIDPTARPRTSSTLFDLSNLSEMMQEKAETKSIYQDEENEEGMEYSRVLISCKKLMEENKIGILEEDAQTRLFDFEESRRGIFVKKSCLFDKIKLVKN